VPAILPAAASSRPDVGAACLPPAMLTWINPATFVRL
jgi:hypothetical protein